MADEWATDFLALYNPAVDRIRSAYPAIPLPSFSYEVWLATLGCAVAALFVLTPLAGPGGWGLTLVGRVYCVLMALNGAAHLALSAWAGEWLPGSTSSPLLLVAAAWLWRAMPTSGEAREHYRRKRAGLAGSREPPPAG